ncbi:hypothetical protein SMACR_03683 [Sordaria macrospora]|uniref:WGS project CABT00000000 data, contig 2.9 n=2 Tax=Sordaria macrospora TaxID=5147 RepID=F7VVW0_SORMK|nr:uncharacterized protein SMAC_03683 [Sordaria macrospora k-hell]KAA8635101.1 hypothetical protein SMACR_03683 [Sordaria macrospora]WPJ66078.1 hypothetical protein SMAC4_03683 [Sordaria macrospora]CCC09651.1 unnamed protein product [Sordaria macrospora k-hell]
MIPTRIVATPFSASVSIIAVIFRLTWYLILVTLFYSTGVTSASITAVRRGSSNDNDGVFQAGIARSLALSSLINTKPSVQKRSATEHVILCDCLSASGIRSSQMAYYSADVQGSPTGGVGIVDTELNTTATWYNATTSATWADTGVTFKAVIGYHVAEDDYVGKGNNGYGDFRCWQRARTGFAYDLKGNGNVCEMKIDCNKAVAPSTDPAYVPLESTTTLTSDDGQSPASAGNTPAPTSTNSAENAQQPGLENKDKDKVISTGAVIGIAMGIVVAFTFLAGGAGFFFARRRRLRKQREQQRRKEARADSTITESHSPGSDLAKSPSAVYELDGEWSRHEMGDDTGHYEIDGQVRCEMDGVDGEIKEKMDDDLFADAADAKQIILCLDEKKDSKMIIDEKKKEKGEKVRVSEKEMEARRDKEERERERERQQQEQQQEQQQQQQQQLEKEQKTTKNAGDDLPMVSPISPLSPPAWTEEGVGQTPFCLPAIMPEPEKFIAEEFRAHNKEMAKREKEGVNLKFRFEEETQKYIKVDIPSASGKDAGGP